MTPPFSAVSKKLWPSLCFRPPSPLLISDKSLMRIFPDPLYDQEGQLQGRPAETISTKVSGKVNLIFYKLNQFPIFLVDIKKYKKRNRKFVTCRIMKNFFTITAAGVTQCEFSINMQI